MAPARPQELEALKVGIETKLRRAAGDLRELATKSADLTQADKAVELAKLIEDIAEQVSDNR